MKTASEFRAAAREALRGKWLVALLVAFVYGIIYRVSSGCCLLLLFLFTGACQLGRAQFNLNLIDRREAKFRDLFSHFDRMGRGFMMALLLSIYLLLWSLLLIIPGIIKSFSYAMTEYIMLDHPEYRAERAITESTILMEGNKARLFRLSLSFFFWELLIMLPLAISLILIKKGVEIPLWLHLYSPLGSLASSLLGTYKQVSFAAFYRDISAAQKKRKRKKKT